MNARSTMLVCLLVSLGTASICFGGQDSLYRSLGLSNVLDERAFAAAMAAREQLAAAGRLRHPDLVTIVDYSKPSKEKRFYVLDLKKRRLLFRELVAHGEGSGVDKATIFSNGGGTHASSPGAYVTAETYCGDHGYSLALDGVERGVNDQARERNIVVHGAEYVSESFVRQHGRTGRSWGCPALDDAVAKTVIDTIKDGSLLYIWSGGRNGGGSCGPDQLRAGRGRCGERPRSLLSTLRRVLNLPLRLSIPRRDRRQL